MAHLLNQLRDSVKYWYLPLLSGIILVLCGIFALTSPEETYLFLTVAFSLSFVTSGILEILFYEQNAKTIRGWGWYIISGLTSLAAGIYMMFDPEVSAVLLPYIVGFTMLLRATQLLGISLNLKDSGLTGWGNLTVASVIGILLSLLLIANPAFTIFSLVTITGTLFIFAGIASVLLAFRLRKVKKLAATVTSRLKREMRDL
ncbi:DUF308 domain-containing protein [Chitinophaga oryzae]|uniref:DUF308 domain-containing protein n=1 Tax=Chitinophaga oryzae TaxID=2725414 RepID=A0AAE6ZDP2_9BACT|nr:DUF308 domain-containing protein [Chitinophaga oryzae]QJB30754.1 DUF308 domain-containing protein [Chitinophaga oryzae]